MCWLCFILFGLLPPVAFVAWCWFHELLRLPALKSVILLEAAPKIVGLIDRQRQAYVLYRAESARISSLVKLPGRRLDLTEILKSIFGTSDEVLVQASRRLLLALKRLVGS